MIVLSNVGELYDGTSADRGAVHHGVDLVLDGERVHALEPHDPARAARSAERGETLVDCSERAVVPGLVDCHGHVTILGVSSEQLDRMNRPEGWALAERILHASLVEGGVTTMRDVGGATHRMKELVDEGVWIGPRLSVAICMLSTTGGHADFRGPDRCHAELSRLWPEAPGRPSSIVDGPWECRKRVREIAACGADLIKICSSPGVASPGDRLEHREFTREEVEAICDEAAARGLRVAAHAHSRSGLELAIDAGVHDLQHVSFLDERLVDRAAERGCVVTPTSWVIHELVRLGGWTPLVEEKIRQVGEVHARAVEAARAGGLPILAGTDPVLPRMHGRNYLEVAALVRDGLAPLEAWHAATGLAAEHIGRPEVGALVPGRRADLLVVRPGVLERPEDLDEPGALVEVVQDGVGHRGGLLELPQRTFRDTARELLGLADAPVEG